MPWGSQVQREDHCPKSAAVGVKRFVWDGVVLDIGWEGLKGLGGMIGLGEDGFSWETLDATWGGMGALIGRDPETGEWWQGDVAGDAWKETGKSLVAWDMWAEDPARAAGTLVGNVVLTVASFGAGAAVKGTATAGRSGQVLTGTLKGASVVNRVLDPTDLPIGGAKALKGFKLDDVLAGLKTNLSDLSTGLSTSLRGIDIDVDIELPGTTVVTSAAPVGTPASSTTTPPPAAATTAGRRQRQPRRRHLQRAPALRADRTTPTRPRRPPSSPSSTSCASTSSSGPGRPAHRRRTTGAGTQPDRQRWQQPQRVGWWRR